MRPRTKKRREEVKKKEMPTSYSMKKGRDKDKGEQDKTCQTT